MRNFGITLGFSTLSALALLVGCGGDDFSANPNTSSGGSSGGGASGAGGSAATGGAATGGVTGTGGGGGAGGEPSCSPGTKPSEDGCIVDERFGVFVDGAGGDDTTGDGTRANPFKTIGVAIASAGSLNRVFVCGGSYPESLVLTADDSALSVFGGLSCDDWSYTGEATAVEPATAGPALRATATKTLLIEDLTFRVESSALPGGSSIGAILSDSELVLRRVSIEAGTGGEGAKASGFDTPAPDGADGNPGSNACSNSNSGGAMAVTECGEQPGSTGGGGGLGGEEIGSGGNGNPGLPSLGGGGPGVGQLDASWTCDTTGTGGGGRAGHNGEPGAPGAPAEGQGSISTDGYSPPAAQPGASGGPGQGGGGGGGAKAPATCANLSTPTGASGGSGGGGGCGGLGGPAGGSGGSSIGIIALNTTLVVHDSTIVALEGGNGGDGARGQSGGGGGRSGQQGGGNASFDACPGGAGGLGGGGGPGGGGAGGHSVGIAWMGIEPTVSGGSVELASSPADGGLGGNGDPALTGDAGIVAPTLEF